MNEQLKELQTKLKDLRKKALLLKDETDLEKNQIKEDEILEQISNLEKNTSKKVYTKKTFDMNLIEEM